MGGVLGAKIGYVLRVKIKIRSNVNSQNFLKFKIQVLINNKIRSS